jgi:predicted ribosome quality control (RQC) complex YloA/Tae2 family protein
MVSNYYTLRLLAANLDGTLRGSEIDEAYCQSKNELQIALTTQGEQRCLTVSCDPSMNFLFHRVQANRAKKNSVDVFRLLWGRVVRQVSIRPGDRELVVECSGNVRLLIRLFGSKSNVLLVDDHNVILDSFLNAKELRGTVISRGEGERSFEVHDVADFRTRLRSIGSIMLPAAIKKLSPLFNTTLIRELCYRAKVSDQKVVAEISDAEIDQLYASYQALLQELGSTAGARLYFETGLPVVFSIINLEHLHNSEVESFESVHDAIRVFIGKSRKQKSVLQEKESLLHFLRQGAERAERTLQKMEEETEVLQRAMQHERYGKLLMANLAQLSKGMREIGLEDVFSRDRSLVLIRLDQKLSPAQNAEHYFNKAKKARAGVEDKLERQDDIRERWELLREFLDRVSDLQTYEQLAEFTATSREQLAKLGYKGLPGETKEKREEAPFRTFTVSGGFQVWVGKSSENNDLLTLKFARPNDLWFHTRGSSGSHVVLRTGTGKGEPSRRALEEAASIAAFYSKMKNAKHVPVAMTERKYVRKPRGAPAGTVTIEREKLLFVNPKLPGEAKE